LRWLVGDIQGCLREFETLLGEIRFDPARDELWCLGDLINRGPDSLGVLRLWRDVGGRGILGNHDAAALLTFSGARPPKRSMASLATLFRARDAGDLFARLRALPVLVRLPSPGRGPDCWIVHAGLHPGWTDLERVADRLNAGSHSDPWLRSPDVIFATNVRCCTAEGRRCGYTGPPGGCPSPYRPWDEFLVGGDLVVHGHWATRGHYRGARTMGLDSGCVHGGALTAWCQDEDRVVSVAASGTRR